LAEFRRFLALRVLPRKTDGQRAHFLNATRQPTDGTVSILRPYKLYRIVHKKYLKDPLYESWVNNSVAVTPLASAEGERDQIS
jgi:hypothetical protein